MSDVITVSDLRKTYAGRAVVDGISFSVRGGEIFGLLGPNGAGKTTTIECLVGLRRPTSGDIQVLGMNPQSNRRQFTSRVSIQPQAASLFNTLTVDETLRLFRSFYSSGIDPNEVRHEIGLDEQRDTRAKNLSGGQLRRLLLGVALVGAPEVVVLDEPSAGLDPAARRELWGTVRALASRGTTVLLSTHHMDEATALCDRVAIVVRGKIVALDNPETLVREREAEAVVTFDAAADADLRDLEALAGGDSMAITPRPAGRQTISVRTSDPDAIVRRITFIPSLRATNINIARGSLEDLFIELSHGDDRHV